MAADINAPSEGTLWIVSAATTPGKHGSGRTPQGNARRWARGFVVEPRYVGPILADACAEGLEVAV